MDWSPEDDIPGRLLHQAALWDNVDLLEDLLKGDQSAMINCQDSWGRTPLHAAAITEDSRCLRILLQAGADPNSKCGPRADNCTALHMSVAHGHAGNVECLLEFGANFTDRDIAGMTALDIAEREGDTECIKLLKNAADERDRSSQELRAAVSRGDVEAARALLQQLGPEAQAVANAGHNTLLYAACQLGRSALISLLLQHGADGRAHPVTGYTPLYAACHHGHVRAAELILDKFPELVQQATMEKWLPLHAGCINGHVEIVRLLLQYQYPRHLLTTFSDPTGRWQWQLAFDPDAQDVTGQTPLYMASLLGNKKLVELLLGWRVPATRVQDKNTEDSPASSITPVPSPGSPTKRRISEGIQNIMSKLSLSSSQTQQDSPHERLVSPLRVNQCGGRGDTALLAAARGGHLEVAAALLQAGADPNVASTAAANNNNSSSGNNNSQSSEDLSTLMIGIGAALAPPATITSHHHHHHANTNSNSSNTNTTSTCSTPLSEAVRQRSLPLVELLLRHGARDDTGDAVAAAAINQDEQIVARLLATKAYPDPEYKINKKCLGVTTSDGADGSAAAFTAAAGRSSSNLTYSSLFPNTATMLNWHNQRCHLSNIRPQWLSAAALHCNPRLKGHPKGNEIALGALTRIDLSNNSLVGLPVVVFQLCSLRYLNVAQNKIERLPVPSETTIKRRSSKKVDSGKLDFGCQVLEELYLQDNRLDELPEALFRLPALVTLDASNNKLRGLPYAMWKAPVLRELSVAFNLLRELPVQDNIGEMDLDNISVSSSDSRLSLSECSNSDSVESNCKRKHWTVSQTELHRHHIWSRHLEITEQILHSEDNVTESSSQLSSLNLAHNLFSSLPVALPCLAVNLTRLNLSYNSLRSMSHITSYPASLKQMDLSHNQITCWPSLPQIEACDSMEMAHLTCYGNQDGACPKTNKNTPATGNRNSRSLRSCILQSVCAHRRHLRLEALRTLVLADNLLPRIQLSTDDEAVGVGYDEDDSDWSVVSAAKARLVFPNLSMLDISNNCLKEIPSSIHELSNLSVLNISGNTDICELPPHMGLLSRLWNLNTRGCSLQEPLRSMIESKKYKTMDIIGYLKSILEDARPYARMKLMIVGIQGIGKTSLLEQLRQEGTPHYRKKPTEHWAKRMGHKHINTKTHRGTNMSTVGVDIGDWVFEKKLRGQSSHGPVVFRTWDFGGQKEYYATHQYFLSRRSLYLVVWRITDGRRGLEEILQWLVNIQARAPNSPVLIVGTHYDAVGESYPAALSEELQHTIRDRFINVADAEKLGLPRVLDTIEVSCRTRHNIRLLCGLVYDTVFSLRPPGSKELLLEQRVPACYLALEECVGALATKLRNGLGGGGPNNTVGPGGAVGGACDPVVVGAERYRALVAHEMSQRGHRPFRDAAELAQATMFLHDNGVLLHYDDATLKDLYFLDPQWLCDVLAHVVTIREINPFARTGLMRLDDLSHLFRSAPALAAPDGRGGHVVSLLNKFEVALTWDSRTLLIPSLLPLTEEDQTPGEAVTVKIALRSKGWAVRSKKLSPSEFGSTPFMLGSPSMPEPPTPRPSHEMTHRPQPDKSITRLLLMSYFPSGFWSRLITRLLADDAVIDIIRGFFVLPAEVSQDAALARVLDVKAEWSLWQTGLRLRYGNITIFKMREVLATTPAPYKHLRFRVKQEGVWCDLDMQGSSILEIHFPVHDLVIRSNPPTDDYQTSSTGDDITIPPCLRTTAQLLSLAVDHIDILLEDWYPTLGTRFVHTSEGRFLVTRIVPCPKCMLCVPSNESNEQPSTSSPGSPSTSSSQNLSDGVSKAFNESSPGPPSIGPGPPPKSAARKSQDSLGGWLSDGDSGVGQSGGSSRAPSIEGHPLLQQQQQQPGPEPEPAPINYSWMVEECILAAYDRRMVTCPAHGDVGLDMIAPDTIFMDLSPKHLIPAADITRGPLLGRGAFGFVFRAQYRSRYYSGGGSGTTSYNREQLGAPPGRRAPIVEVAMKMLQPVQPGPRAGQSAHIAYKAAQGKWERDPLQYACKAYCTARQELNILLNLSHPNIVPLVGVCARPLALVLDLAPRGALDAALRDLRRSGARVLPSCLRALVLQAARALEYLHGRRVIYRDLKAENVLVWRLPPPGMDACHEEDVHIKLADYGISRLTLPAGGAKGFGGTEGFMAPEMARYNGEEEYTEKVDCFSFGMLLYELITLRQPFEGHEAVKECVLEGGRPPLTHRETQCPSYCLDLMSLCWSQQPADRPSASQIVSVASAPEFAHLLDVVSLDHQAPVTSACAANLDQDEPGLWDVWLLAANRRVDVLRCAARGFQSGHCLAQGAQSGPPSVGPNMVPPPRPTASCRIGSAVWIGDSHGRIHAYDAEDCTPLFAYSLESAPELELITSASAVSCILPLPTIKDPTEAHNQEPVTPTGPARVACSLSGGRLFLVDGNAAPTGPTHGEGSFVLTELGPGSRVYSLAAVNVYGNDEDNSSCELWCGLSGGDIGVFSLREHSVCGHETVGHFPGRPHRQYETPATSPESPDTGVHVARTRRTHEGPHQQQQQHFDPYADMAVTLLQAAGSRVWSYVYPGCIVYQWDHESRCIENRLDCSKLVPCSESLKSISIEEHLSPGRCQVTSLCVLGDEIYIGTIWGCIIIAEMESLRPITIFRPYEEEVRAIIPLVTFSETTSTTNNDTKDTTTDDASQQSEPLLITVGRGYRNLIERYTDNLTEISGQSSGANQASTGALINDRTDHAHAILWRAGRWGVA